MKTRTYFMPWPISANARMGVSRGRAILSEAARRWYADVGEELMLQRPKAVKGPVELSIQLCSPTKRKYDIDNRAKTTIDALVRHGIIEADDNTIVRKLTIEAHDGGTVGALVTVSPIADKTPKEAA